MKTGSISTNNTTLYSLPYGVYSLLQAQYATDVPSEIVMSYDTYMYISSTQTEILFPIDTNKTTWFSRYNHGEWFKHGS